jgi:hypothetical protein
MSESRSMPSWQRKGIALLPLGILLFALLTIFAAYRATFQSGVLDFQHGRVITPPISMLMFAGPGRRIGQVGFPMVSILFGCCAPTFFGGVTRTVGNEAHQTLLTSLRITSSIAFCCLAVVGLLPLQPDLALVITQHAPVHWTSIVHQTAAAFFFLFCILHMGIWLYFCRVSCDPRLFLHATKSPKSFRIKSACFVLCFLPLPTAFLLHPISPARRHFHYLSQADAGGVTQYALVTCVAGFFASYSCELWHLQKQQQQQQGPEERKQDKTRKSQPKDE